MIVHICLGTIGFCAARVRYPDGCSLNMFVMPLAAG